jgi:glutaredoxin
MLDLDKIPYVTYNVEEASSKWVLSLMKEANIKTVPQIFAHDGNLVGGFRELETLMGFINNKGEY